MKLDFQDNLKTVFSLPNEVKEGDFVDFKIGAKPNCDPVFFTGEVPYVEDMNVLTRNINDLYCEWYRTGGRNTIRKYFEDLEKSK